MSFQPLLAFDNQTEDFALGFEAGRVWAMLHGPFDEISLIVHGQNAEVFQRMVEALPDVGMRWEELEGDWCQATFRNVA